MPMEGWAPSHPPIFPPSCPPFLSQRRFQGWTWETRPKRHFCNPPFGAEIEKEREREKEKNRGERMQKREKKSWQPLFSPSARLLPAKGTPFSIKPSESLSFLAYSFTMT